MKFSLDDRCKVIAEQLKRCLSGPRQKSRLIAAISLSRLGVVQRRAFYTAKNGVHHRRKHIQFTTRFTRRSLGEGGTTTTTATMTADFFARKAAEHSAQCTDQENQRRRKNGRTPNVSHVFTEEESEVFFRGTETAADEIYSQPPAFGSAVFAHA